MLKSEHFTPAVSLSQLNQTKRAAGRPKDLEALAELEAIEEDGP